MTVYNFAQWLATATGLAAAGLVIFIAGAGMGLFIGNISDKGAR
jgi:hypothetical protein